jgi:hypothetical protein
VLVNKLGLLQSEVYGFVRTVPELSSGRTKKKLSERPTRSLMVACEIAHTGSPCVVLIEVKDDSAPSMQSQSRLERRNYTEELEA